MIAQIPSAAIGKGHGLLHETQGQLDILKPLIKHADRITDGEDAMQQLGTAWRELKSGRPRPVGPEIPV